MTELDSFIDWAKNQDLDVTIVDFSGAVKLPDKNGGKRDFCFEEFETDIAWLSWQAATQREGFKFVPVNPDNEFISSLASVICDEFDTTIDGSAHCAKEAYKAMIGAVDDH